MLPAAPGAYKAPRRRRGQPQHASFSRFLFFSASPDPNPRPGRRTSPPFRAPPSPADTARISAVSPPTSSTKQRSLGSPLLRQSGGARAAGLRRSPAFPAISGDGVELHTLVVSFRVDWCSSPPRLQPVACRRRAPARPSARARRRRPFGGHWRAAPPSFGSRSSCASNARARVAPGALQRHPRAPSGRPWPG